MKGSLASAMMGCCWDLERVELANLPPTLSIWFLSNQGFSALSLLDLRSGLFLRMARISLGKSLAWDCWSSQCSAFSLLDPVRMQVLYTSGEMICFTESVQWSGKCLSATLVSRGTSVVLTASRSVLVSNGKDLSAVLVSS